MQMKVLDKRNILEHEVTTYGELEKPLFLAKDVAVWIGYEISNVAKMVKNVDDDEKIIARINNTSATFLTEDGLYEVLMLSRKPVAKQFKKQVKKILKELRLKNRPYSNLSKELQAILVIDEQQQLIKKDIIEVRKDLIDFKEEIPLFTVECEEITRLVRKIGIEVLNGKNSNTYKDKSLRSKVYSDIYRQLRREFGVRSYKAIKRRQLDQALEAVENYKLPTYLIEEIELAKFKNVEGLVC
ncbi:ORF6C domain-containing protein [Paraclostridium sordellii]|uniref:ORF6C domain-containing protein n=1 Tax=Paraclostridium sordellii TaxID=1505 RepID=UPI0005DD4E0A|nr:ORF6C domain-containing protein [Paeniclostridium sordellii]CEN21244.1 prophage antirepressor [[Clostridium] sordellii] [Paeniclostridium sordellii]